MSATDTNSSPFNSISTTRSTLVKKPISPFVFPIATSILACVSALFYQLNLALTHIPFITTKTSWLNLIFGKYIWFWTSFIYLVALKQQLKKTKHTFFSNSWIYSSLLRFTLATLYWIFITQWCFGPSILERIRSWTGKCSNPNFHSNQEACLLHQEEWVHGYDISGHCFLLHHAYLVLMHEVPNEFSVQMVCAFWAALVVITIFYYHHFIELMNGIFIGSLFSMIVYSPQFQYPFNQG